MKKRGKEEGKKGKRIGRIAEPRKWITNVRDGKRERDSSSGQTNWIPIFPLRLVSSSRQADRLPPAWISSVQPITLIQCLCPIQCSLVNSFFSSARPRGGFTGARANLKKKKKSYIIEKPYSICQLEIQCNSQIISLWKQGVEGIAGLLIFVWEYLNIKQWVDWAPNEPRQECEMCYQGQYRCCFLSGGGGQKESNLWKNLH